MASVELSKGYEPQDVEKRWLEYWDRQGSFTADAESRAEPFSIVIPPPNVTGTLHMGHALNITLQDVLCRYKRQRGFNVLWVPGTDHAGIATQNVVERAMDAEGSNREEMGREGFVRRVWQWKEEYGDKILNQIRRLGASVDWSRLRFTMDDGLSRAVREVFVRLYEEGLIYQGDYIINWCPRCRTALSDLEVEHEETAGGLYHVYYLLADGSGHLVVATTRPETILGDTAVAVHPEDERFARLIGRQVRVPLTDRSAPVVGDSYVDMHFGTGCLKVTPLHDPNDFELAERNGLPGIKVIDEDGRMTSEAGQRYAGMDRFACRRTVVADLEEQGLLQKKEKHEHKVGHCYRCHTPIEPAVSTQWFVAVAPLAARAKEAVESGRTRILPPNWVNLYNEWLENIRDWCISRQIWWGHRIPAWYCRDCGKVAVSREDLERCPECGSAHLKQEEDVLDTWFSSALWPFSTLGWPERTRDLEVYYPTSVLITAFDIIFFWVARMMMMGLHFMGEVPFRHVYIHALVRDEQGRKMSKSTGNVIDPLLMIDRYGADALRFTLSVFAAMGRDVKLSEARIEGYKHFINKIWNAARFALLNLDREVPELPGNESLGFTHRYVLHEMERVKSEVADSLEGYHFNEAAHTLYQFIWHTYCDWYLEMIKQELSSGDREVRGNAQAVLHRTFCELLVLLHPFVPFVTQEIWSRFPGTGSEDLARVQYPEKRPGRVDEDLPQWMDFLQQVVISVRNIRSELNINPARKLELLVRTGGASAAFLQQMEPVITQLARLSGLSVDADLAPPRTVATAVVGQSELFVPLEGVVDFKEELDRLEKEIAKVDKNLQSVERKLANEDFLAKAPQEVVSKEKERHRELAQKREKLQRLQERLGELAEG
jgi:valyl-tRNA synthetase